MRSNNKFRCAGFRPAGTPRVLAMACGLSIFAAVGWSSSARAATYTLLDLGTLGGATSGTGNASAGNIGFNGGGGNGGAINNLGQVVGLSTTGGGATHGFRTESDSAIADTDDLGTLGGSDSRALGVNDSGQAVGQSSFAAGFSHAYRTTANGVITPASDLGALGTVGGEQFHNSNANGINASGQVVGYSDTNTGGVLHAFRTAPNGVITAESDLGTLGGRVSVAAGINSLGQTVGASGLSGNTAGHAFRTTATGGIDGSSDLGTLGGTFSAAFAINDAGVTVGYSDLANGERHAVRTAPNGSYTDATDLGTLGGILSEAISVNATGQTVGFSVLADGTTGHAFLENIGGTMIDLNSLIDPDSGFVLEEADGINDAGQIAGYGMIDGEQHAFLLTPSASVPEPTSALLIALGTAGLSLRRRNRATQ